MESDEPFSSYDWESGEDLLKIQKMIAILMEGFHKAVKEDEDSIYMGNNYDTFIEVESVFEEKTLVVNFEADSMHISLSHLIISSEKSIKDFFEENFNVENEDIIENYIQNSSIFKRELRSKEKMDTAKILKFCAFDGDFYKYSKTFPVIQMAKNIEVPMNSYFISLFDSFFKDVSHELSKKTEGEFSIIEMVNPKDNNSICDSCINKIRKNTIGCDHCFDFELVY